MTCIQEQVMHEYVADADTVEMHVNSFQTEPEISRASYFDGT